MSDQLDLFMASAKSEESGNVDRPKEIKVAYENQVTENDLQDQHDMELTPHHLTPRQWALLNLIKQNSFVGKRKTSQKEICDALKEYGYEWNEDEKCHDHCTAIWNDIKDINLSFDTDKIIIAYRFEYWIGDEEQTRAYIDKLWNDLAPRLSRYWSYYNKVQRNGQGQLLSRKGEPIDENSKARDFIESYGKEKIE